MPWRGELSSSATYSQLQTMKAASTIRNAVQLPVKLVLTLPAWSVVVFMLAGGDTSSELATLKGMPTIRASIR